MKRLTVITALLVCSFIISCLVYAADDPVIKAYNAYVNAFINAKTIDDLYPYLSEKNAKDLREAPKDQVGMLLQYGKMTYENMETKSIKSEVNGNTATITLDAVDKSMNNSKMSGNIRMVKENGAWKVDEETYNTKME